MATTSVAKTDLFEFLERYKLGVLGTVSPEGVPQSALVGIAVTPALEIIFDTVKSSRKFRNLDRKPGLLVCHRMGGRNNGAVPR